MSEAAKTPAELSSQFRSAPDARLLGQLHLIECTPFDRSTKDFMREVARESFQCEGRCSKPIAEIATCIGVSLRQAQRIAKDAVQRGILGRQTQPGRPSSYWLRSVALQDKARAASGKTPILEGMTHVLAGVTPRVRGDGAGRGDTFFCQSQCQLTNKTDERNLLREKQPTGLFEVLDVDRERLRNKEKRGARLAELRYEEAGRPESGELVNFLDATLKFSEREGIIYPKVLLLRLRQIRRGQFTPRDMTGFDAGQDTASETWRDIAGFRNNLRPSIACLWESFTRGMADIPFRERVQYFLNELDVKHITLELRERAALKDLAAPANQSSVASDSDNSNLDTSASGGNETVGSSDVEEG
jgi:hypothetical protein